MIVSFVDFTPPPRFDAVPWNRVRIEESVLEDGPYTVVETLTLSPLDADPTNPQPRNFTTDEALPESKYFRVVFLDAADNESFPSPSISNVTLRDIRPSLEDIAAILNARITTQGGGTKTTFDATTKPTANQVNSIISQVALDVSARVRASIPQSQQERGRYLVAVMASALVELRFHPEKSAEEGSTYQEMIDLFNAEIDDWVEACRWPLTPNVF